jgi:replicative DNA helicase
MSQNIPSSTIYKKFFRKVNRGAQGYNKGLPMGFPKLEEYIAGIQKGRYDVIFAEPGCGKSSIVWYSYIMYPYDHCFKNKGKIKDTVKIRLYSLEVSAEEVVAKLVALKLFTDYGILVDSKYIFSKGNNRINGDIYKKINEMASYFDEMFKHVTIIDRPMTPSNIKDDVIKFARENGTVEEDEDGKIKYTPNDPDQTILIITDTVGNLKVEPINGIASVKTTIDLHSAHCRDIFRNQLGFSCVNVSHSNRAMDDINRGRYGELFPKMSDIKETNMLAQDANLVMTLFDPTNHINPNNNLDKFMDYDILKLKNRFRAVGILKNREGENNKRVGLIYLGECGYFEELPNSKSMNDEAYNRVSSFKHFLALTAEDKERLLKKLKN